VIHRRWMLLLAVAVFALLANGLAIAARWPTPSEAERKAALLRVGMSWDETFVLMAPRWPMTYLGNEAGTRLYIGWPQSDGSQITVTFVPVEEGGRRALSIRTTPPPVHPLTRLRRTLARAFPFVGE
jgi:uncharacterized protein YndB with AHSA1/START domain